MEDSNIPVLRLSELYLIAAEAAVKLNNNDKAVKYLDAIVSRANPEKTVQGKTVTLDDVLLERRKSCSVKDTVSSTPFVIIRLSCARSRPRNSRK